MKGLFLASEPLPVQVFEKTVSVRSAVASSTTMRSKNLKRFTSSLITALFLFLFPILASAQATSSSTAVTGTATDSTGAVITGATVKLSNSKTGQESTTTTNDQGVYQFSQVPPGSGYRLLFTASGFQTLALDNVSLGVGSTETHNVQLTAGQVSETVIVQDQGGAATLNTTDASLSNTIETKRLQELPVQFRGSPAALIGLQPGVVGNNVGTGATNRVGSVTGSRADQGNITVDGIDANDQATGQAFATTGNAPIDAIQEFRTVSTNPTAAEGRSSGGQIEMITKSGSNRFHGSLREFNRTALTAANSFFNNKNGVDRPQLTRNQFGGSIGGPIYLPRFGEGGKSYSSGKDKLFFFFDYEGRRDAQGVSYLRIVPLAHVRSGGLGYLNNTAGCGTDARLNTAPQCITVLTPAQIAALDPQHVGVNAALLNFINQRYPLPNDFTAGNGINTAGFRFNAPSHRADNNYTARVDWNITDRQRAFVRFSKIQALQTDTTNTVAQQFPSDPESGQIITGDNAWVVGHTWTVSPSVINTATVGVSKSVLQFPAPFAPTFPIQFGAPSATGGSWASLLSSPFPRINTQKRVVPVPTFRDDLTWMSGAHTMQFGTQIKPIRQQTSLVSDFNSPTVGLGGNLPSLDASARPGTLGSGNARSTNFDTAFAFLLGVIPSVTTRFNYTPSGGTFPLGTGRNRDWRYNEFEFYGQDTWKVRSDLTVSYGVRYHVYPAPYEANGLQSIPNVDFETLFNQRIANGIAGITSATSEPILVYNKGGKANNAAPFYKTDWNNFAPRLSFAYNPSFKDGFLGKVFGDRKAVIRAGGAVTYDRPGGGISFLQDQSSYIFDALVTTNAAVPSVASGLLNLPRFVNINSVPVTNVAPTVTLPFTPDPAGTRNQATNYAVDPNFKIPYSMQYSVGIQRELPGNFLMEVSYVGRQGRKLFTLADAAQIVDFRDPASGQSMLDAFNIVQAQLAAGGPAAVTPQPWFENQINAARVAGGLVPCLQRAVPNPPPCTNLYLAGPFASLVEIGDTADTIQALFANRLLRPNIGLSSQFGTNAYVVNKGSSSYNGMLVSLRKRFSRGFQFDVNYTWSHSMDNQSTVANTTTSGGLICDATNLRVCRGPSDFDIRHLFNANGIWELPIGRGRTFGRNMPGWADTIIGGWELTGIVTARSGLPFSLATVSWPRSFIFDGANGVPAVLSGNASALKAKIHNAPDGSIQFFADPEAARNATSYPRHGEIGNRDALRSTPFWSMDTALIKKFKLPWSETQRLQVRWEAYNAFNHNVFGLPDTDIGSTTFGQVTTVQSTARVMQFGIRWDF